MEAEIITIGTEILLGEIVDTNTRTIARSLREIGLDIYRTSTVGDNASRIGQAVQESMQRAAAVITTGGLGPTVDDATREGVAMAFGIDVEYIPELWDQIQERFAAFGRSPSENNQRQAYIPRGGIPIENLVGTAPAFIMEAENSCVISLPGVPAEMIYLLEGRVIPYLKKRLKLSGMIKSRILRTAGLGESTIDKRIEDLERLSNPTVGLSAHPGRVDLRITAKAQSEHEADEMIWGIEATLKQRLGDYIYGVDDQTLESIIATWLRDQGMKLCTVEYGTAGALAAGFTPFNDIYAGGLVLNTLADTLQANAELQKLRSSSGSECGIALILVEEQDRHRLICHLQLGTEVRSQENHYSGKFVYAEARAVSICIERMRQMMLAIAGDDRQNDS